RGSRRSRTCRCALAGGRRPSARRTCAGGSSNGRARAAPARRALRPPGPRRSHGGARAHLGRPGPRAEVTPPDRYCTGTEAVAVTWPVTSFARRITVYVPLGTILRTRNGTVAESVLPAGTLSVIHGLVQDQLVPARKVALNETKRSTLAVFVNDAKI